SDLQQVEQPALVLLRPGQKAPEQLAAAAIEVPPDASTAALRELIRVAMENIVLKQQVAQLEAETHRRHRQFRELNRIGIALSAERDIDRLQSFILTTMRQLTHADGASLWLKMDEDGAAKLPFETRLTVDNVADEVISFQPDDLEMIESIASQAAVALDNKNLLESIQTLFDGFVQASVTAIEQRDPSTAGHSGRVEALTTSLARAVTDLGTGRFKDVYLTEDQLKELRYACLLHDFGKVGVREHILVKA